MVSKFERENLTDEQVAEMEKFDKEQRNNDDLFNYHCLCVDVDDLGDTIPRPRVAVNCWTKKQWRLKKADADIEGAE